MAISIALKAFGRAKALTDRYESRTYRAMNTEKGCLESNSGMCFRLPLCCHDVSKLCRGFPQKSLDSGRARQISRGRVFSWFWKHWQRRHPLACFRKASLPLPSWWRSQEKYYCSFTALNTFLDPSPKKSVLWLWSRQAVMSSSSALSIHLNMFNLP